ncbi:hypothetical protein BGZ76_010144, partial [Entomortierella beljakovae]
MIPPLSSTIVATVYITLITILSCVQFRRSQTPLRLGSAVMAVTGLSISALSIVYTSDKMSLSIFWVYQFVAELISVTWVVVTIIHLGYAFYPATRHQTLIWRTALGSVILYDVVAIAELSYYCYAVWGSGSLPKEGTPVLWIYWVRQLVKVLACGVTIAYLFVPLVRHHHSTGVAMIADSNTLAVGTWYLTALGVTFLGYGIMFIYYMTRRSEVFTPQGQALDLCIRLIACPIFSLPPPQCLINYFRAKYGSATRDDNPNTMIEEGITNDPRPRRPPMLVSLSSTPSARRSGYIFGPSYNEHNQKRTSLDSDIEEEDDLCKRYIDEEINIGTTSSLETAAETFPKPRSVSKNSSSDVKECKSSERTSVDDTAVSSLSISIPSDSSPSTPVRDEVVNGPPLSFMQGVLPDKNEEAETAIAARRISRRLTMEGRKDDLDFLNITGLMKRANRSSSAPTPKSPTLSSAVGGLNVPAPAPVPVPTIPAHFEIRAHGLLKKARLSVINDSSAMEESAEHQPNSPQDTFQLSSFVKTQAQTPALESTPDKPLTITTENDTQISASNQKDSLNRVHPV